MGETLGWRWIEGLMAIFTGSVGIVYLFTVPETYAPVILHRRAQKLTKMTGKIYKTHIEIQQGPKTLRGVLKIALSRPWVMLIREPIVTVLSIYQAIIYATLYLCFGNTLRFWRLLKRTDLEDSCISNRVSRETKLVTRHRWSGILGRYSRHDIDDPIQHLDQPAIRKAE